jgi:hypothetical protein
VFACFRNFFLTVYIHTMGRVVHGASCRWGELSMGRIVHGANCPWGELSVGRIVRGANCPWGEMSVGRDVRGAKCTYFVILYRRRVSKQDVQVTKVDSHPRSKAGDEVLIRGHLTWMIVSLKIDSLKNRKVDIFRTGLRVL